MALTPGQGMVISGQKNNRNASLTGLTCFNIFHSLERQCLNLVAGMVQWQHSILLNEDIAYLGSIYPTQLSDGQKSVFKKPSSPQTFLSVMYVTSINGGGQGLNSLSMVVVCIA
ncbi:hypothetical protein OI70_15590 [Dickeya fangzhongdai]|nr:hypothetical protein OI70_15590 [Dickeya fangzhongdai]